MTSTLSVDRPERSSFSWWGLAIVASIIIVANVLYFGGWSNPDAIGWTSAIATEVCHRGLCLQPSIDPNVGFITEAMGRLAAHDWLHLHLPWWNPFEGLGQPLAGEMQSGALSPLVVLFALPGGLTWFHLALELIGGVSTYLFLRRLFPAELIAVVGGVLFGLNGTFAWLGNAVENPVPFLAMGLLGVELIVTGARRGVWRWGALALAVALSVYAGFPEVASLDLLFVAFYAVVRSFSLSRREQFEMGKQFGLGLAVAGLLSLPLLVAFKDFLKVANIGLHTNATGIVISTKAFPMLLAPYVYGPISFTKPINQYWGGIGGYVGISVFALAMYGLLGAAHRWLRVALAFWVLIAVLGSLDPTARTMWNIVPGLHQIVLCRYIIPSLEMAVIVLAMFGLDDLLHQRHRRVTWLATSVASMAILVGVEYYASTEAVTPGRVFHAFMLAGRIVPFLVLAVVIAAGFQRKRYLIGGLLALAIVGESLFNFMATEVLVPATVTQNTPALTYLQTHLGLERFASTGPISPNWGSYFAIDQLNAHDLPYPQAFATYAQANLPIGMPQVAFRYMVYQGPPEAALYEASIASHLANFESAGVKYLLTWAAEPLNPTLRAEGLTPVYEDSMVTIYLLPGAKPMFTAPNCVTKNPTLNTVQLSCQQASTLERLELTMPGWSASVNGHAASVGSTGPFQTVSVPQGTSTVTFTFLPPHERLAETAFVLGVASLVAIRRRNWLHRQGRRWTLPTWVRRPRRA